MNYLELLKPEAEKSIRSLAADVVKLTRQLASLRKHGETERGNAKALEERQAELKGMAGQRVAEGQNAYASWKVALKRVTADLAASKEAVATFKTDLIPTAERALAAAKVKVQAGLIDLAKASLPVCERRMGELIGEVVLERTRFMAACDTIFKDYGGDFTGKNRVYPDGVYLRPDPYRPSMQIATGLEESVYDPANAPLRGACLSPPPPAPDAQDAPGPTPADAPDAPAASETRPDAPAGQNTRETGPTIDADGQTRPKPHRVLTGEPEMLPPDVIEELAAEEAVTLDEEAAAAADADDAAEAAEAADAAFDAVETKAEGGIYGPGCQRCGD